MCRCKIRHVVRRIRSNGRGGLSLQIKTLIVGGSGPRQAEDCESEKLASRSSVWTPAGLYTPSWRYVSAEQRSNPKV